MKKDYAWRYQSLYGKADAQEVGERIEWLLEQHGGALDRETLLADARKPSSPLHKCLVLDKDEALEKMQRINVRNVMSLLMQAGANGKSNGRRAFLKIRPNGKPREKKMYVTRQHVMQSPQLREQYEERFFRDLNALVRRNADARGIMKPLIDRITRDLKKSKQLTV